MYIGDDTMQVHSAPCHVAECTCVVSSPMYTSPEGLNYFQRPQEYLIQSAADIFSMACVLYELLTDLSAFVRTADRHAGELSFDQLRQLVLWRQGQWVSSFSATAIVWAFIHFALQSVCSSRL